MESIYIRLRGEVLGPLTGDAARAVFLERKLTPSHEVSHDGEEWFPAARIWEQLHDDASPAAKVRSRVTDAVAQPITASPRPRKPPSGITAPPPPPTRSSRKPKTPSDIRPPTVELSADALTPTAEEIELAPAPIGPIQTLLSILLPTAIVAQLVAAAVSLHFGMHTRQVYGELLGGTVTRVGLEEKRRALEPALNQANFGVLAGSMIVFVLYCLWIYFTDDVLHRRRLRRLRYSRWWCVGWELVPICNLWSPYQILTEVWHGAAARTKINWKHAMPLTIRWYWFVKLVSACVVPIIVYLAYDASSKTTDMKTPADALAALESITTYLGFSLGYTAIAVVCYLSMLLIVLRISWRLRAKGSTSPAPPDSPSTGGEAEAV